MRARVDSGTFDVSPIAICIRVHDTDAKEFYRTDELAKDVVAAIDVLRTKRMGKFVLHGHSYGTVLATHVAHLLADPTLPQPEAVVLEGVLARAFTTEWTAASYVDEWSFQKATLSPAVRSALREAKPLGYDAKTWGSFFMVMTSQLGPDATQDLPVATIARVHQTKRWRH